MPYTFLENLKDGKVFNSKYHSGMKFVKGGECKVVVMANCVPEWWKLTRRRWAVYTVIDQDGDLTRIHNPTPELKDNFEAMEKMGFVLRLNPLNKKMEFFWNLEKHGNFVRPKTLS